MTTTVTGRLADGREILPETFADLVDSAVNPVQAISFGDSGDLVVAFGGPDLPQPVRLACLRRIVSSTAAEETLRAQIDDTYTVIAGWEDPDHLSNAAIFSRMKVLTGQVQALTQLIQPDEES